MDIASSLVAFEAWDWNKKKQTPAQRGVEHRKRDAL